VKQKIGKSFVVAIVPGVPMMMVVEWCRSLVDVQPRLDDMLLTLTCDIAAAIDIKQTNSDD